MSNKTAWSAAAIAAAVAMTCGAPVQAADLGVRRPSPVYHDEPLYHAPTNWSGVYFGGHLGGAWSGVDIVDRYGNGDPYAAGTLNSTGIIGGGQLGLNWQLGSLVLGFEGDLGGLDRPASGFTPFAGDAYEISGGLYGDLTGRLGLAFDRTLLYAKGGAAFLNSDATITYANGNQYTSNDTNWGWTAGGGAEFLITPSWSIKAEYQHFDFGDTNIATGHDGGGATFGPSTSDAVTAGFNYHFGKSSGPLK